MSNSNHCAGRTLSFKARKAYSGPQYGKTCYSVSIIAIFLSFLSKSGQIQPFLSQFNLKMDKHSIFYSLSTVSSDSVA